MSAKNKYVYGSKRWLAQELKRRIERAIKARMKNQSARWVKQCKEDKEIGGDNLNDSIELAKLAIRKFAAKEVWPFNSFLNGSELGNHPEMMRFLLRVGKAIRLNWPEQKVSAGSLAQFLYPKQADECPERK
jgi:hypothetical protein